ncbi:MAG: hypothetical protein IID45_04565 [Planctomycetes bacterium]|nr:hypothetical protein [Planctomycetota bacterium]
MPQILWLAFEQPPHADAVTYPATEDDLPFVLEWLTLTHARRQQLAEQLRNYLAEQRQTSFFDRPSVPCRRASGLYHLVAWRLAKWLSCVLPAEDGALATTVFKIRTRLDGGKIAMVAGSAVKQMAGCATLNRAFPGVRPNHSTSRKKRIFVR